MQKCGPWLVQSAVAALVHVQLSNFLTIKLKTVTPCCLATTAVPDMENIGGPIKHFKYVLAPHCTAAAYIYLMHNVLPILH